MGVQVFDAALLPYRHLQATSIRDLGVYDNGADCTAAFQAAIDLGVPLMVPDTDTGFLVNASSTALMVPAGARIVGQGPASIIQIGTSTLYPLFDCEDNDDIEISGLWLKGNSGTQTSSSSGSSAIKAEGGSRLKFNGNRITSWTRHGIQLDDVTDAWVEKNYIDGTHRGAGVLCSRTAPSTRVTVKGNHIRNTAQGNIQAFFGVAGWVVEGNTCDTTGVGSPGDDGTQIADNITGYVLTASGEASDGTFTGNTLRNSANHAMHIGGNRLVVTGNVAYNPANSGYFFAKAPNADPDASELYTITGNSVEFADNTVATHIGYNLRDMDGFTLTGNLSKNAYDGIELNGIDDMSNGVVSGNGIFDYGRSGVRLRNNVHGVQVTGNRLVADTGETTVDILAELVTAVESDNRIHGNFSTGADTVYFQWPDSGIRILSGTTGVAASHTGDTNETVLATFTIPALPSGFVGLLDVLAGFTVTNSANNKTLRMRLGGIGGTVLAAPVVTTTTILAYDRKTFLRAALNSQVVSFNSTNTNSSGSGNGVSYPTATVDMSSSVTVVITGQLANSGETITLEFCRAMLQRVLT